MESFSKLKVENKIHVKSCFRRVKSITLIKNDIMKTINISLFVLLLSMTINVQGQVAIGKPGVDGDALLDFGTEVRGMVLSPVEDVDNMTAQASPGTIAFDGATGSFRFLDNSGTWSTAVLGGTTGGAQAGPDLSKIFIGTPTSAAQGVVVFGKDVGETKAVVLPKLANGNLRFSNPVAGLMYYDTILKGVMVYNGSEWKKF